MRKVFSIGLAIGLAVTVVAGCAGGNNDKEQSKQTAAPSATAGKKIRIDMMAASWKGGGWPDDNHPIIKYINEKFNVDLHVQWVPSGSYAEKMAVVAASGNLPDVIRIDSQVDFMNWQKQGALLDLKPFFSKYPNLQKGWSEEDLQSMSPVGKIFGFPIPNGVSNTIFVRTDWMEKLNIPLPKEDEFTVDKFYEIAKLFATKDPDGNNVKDTFGFTADKNGVNPELQFAFGIANGWKEEGGQLIPANVQSKEWKDYLSFMRKAYEEGVLDQDFVTNANLNDKYALGKIGFADMHYTLRNTTNQGLSKISPNARFDYLSPPKGPSGVRGNPTPISGVMKVTLNAKLDAEKRDRILQLFDWWVSDEGTDILMNGIEGVHYKKNADGTFSLTPEAAAEGETRQALLWNWVLKKKFDRDNIYKWSDKKFSDEIQKSLTNARKYPVPNKGAAYLPLSKTYTEKSKDLDMKFTQAVVEIIAGKKPVDSIDQAIKEWKANGGDQIVKEVNEQNAAMKK